MEGRYYRWHCSVCDMPIIDSTTEEISSFDRERVRDCLRCEKITPHVMMPYRQLTDYEMACVYKQYETVRR